MKKISIFFVLLGLIAGNFFYSTAYAWDHSVELGYGYSHDPNHTRYNNSGVLLSGDLLPLWRSPWLFFSVTGSLGRWYTTSPHNKNLSSVAASLALRFYPFQDFNCEIAPYLLASFGPAFISSRHYGENTQAKNITIQSNLGLGVEIASFDVNLRLHHFSNAGLSKPNEGFNVLYLLSIGYLF